MTHSVPKSCKAVVLDGPGAAWTIKDVRVKKPERGEILVRVQACGVCHSDFFLQQGAFGPLGTFPRIPGHEAIGIVCAVGEGEKRWQVGDKVGAAWHGAHDGTCKWCNRGMFQACENELVNGVNRDGGYTEYMTIRTEAAVRIPQEADAAEYAPLLCAGVTVFNGIRKMNITPGDTVAVQGLGGLGHLALQYARRMGYRTVALSSSASKKDFAMELGATDYVDTSKEDAAEVLRKMGGASLIVVTAPNADLMGPLVHGLGPLGKLLILAPVGDIAVNTVPMVMKGISVHGWPAGHALDTEEAISFAQHQKVKCVIERYGFSQVEEAIQKMEANKLRFRAVIVMEEQVSVDKDRHDRRGEEE